VNGQLPAAGQGEYEGMFSYHRSFSVADVESLHEERHSGDLDEEDEGVEEL
jgi:hypothetical protein